MKYDYHIHTEFSHDSRLKGTDLAAKAIACSYDEIAITEHLDLLPHELSVCGLPSLTKYRTAVTKLQSEFPDLSILFGIEIGDYHRVKDFANSLVAETDFDIILGSVHFLSDNSNMAMPLKRELSKQQTIEYYKYNLELVSTCDFDVLAHLGVYKRYYPYVPDESYAIPILKDIFATMIERKIALEINFGPLRRGYANLHPENEHIELYMSMGGTLFSIGSDAHEIGHFDDFYNRVPSEFSTPFRYNK
jgi:histidinol-phosphatase (PHP family)